MSLVFPTLFLLINLSASLFPALPLTGLQSTALYCAVLNFLSFFVPGEFVNPAVPLLEFFTKRKSLKHASLTILLHVGTSLFVPYLLLSSASKKAVNSLAWPSPYIASVGALNQEELVSLFRHEFTFSLVMYAIPAVLPLFWAASAASVISYTASHIGFGPAPGIVNPLFSVSYWVIHKHSSLLGVHLAAEFSAILLIGLCSRMLQPTGESSKQIPDSSMAASKDKKEKVSNSETSPDSRENVSLRAKKNKKKTT